MKYQLVLQWPFSSNADYDRLVALEEMIEKGLGEIGIVDGHDFGSGEMNIFIHTDEPEAAFAMVKGLLDLNKQVGALRAGYREIEGGEFTPIFPQGIKQFSVI